MMGPAAQRRMAERTARQADREAKRSARRAEQDAAREEREMRHTDDMRRMAAEMESQNGIMAGITPPVLENTPETMFGRRERRRGQQE